MSDRGDVNEKQNGIHAGIYILQYGSSRTNLRARDTSTFSLFLLLKCITRGRSLDRRNCAVRATESRNAIKFISLHCIRFIHQLL
jgi:hypothetical protein